MVGVSLQLPRLDRAFALLLTVLGLGAVVFTWVQVARTIAEAKPPASTVRATAIVWDGRVYQSPAKLARWLRSRGATYAEWTKLHPVGRDLLERRLAAPSKRTHPAVQRSKPAGSTRTAAPAKRPERSAAPASQASTPSAAITAAPTRSPVNESLRSTGHPIGRIFIALFALLAAACAWTAMLPRALLQRFPNLGRSIAPYRALLLGGAAALMIGVVAGAVLN
jgi:hypothetical protein